MNIHNFLLFIILPFIIMMAALIMWFHYKTRSRPWIPSVEGKILSKSISLDLTEQILQEIRNRLKLTPIIFIVIPLFIYVFIMAILILNEDTEAHNKIAPIFLGLMIMGSIFGYFSRKHSIEQNIKAFELAQNKELVFQITNEGLSVPVLMLTNPAFWRATENNMHFLMINWSEIEKFEVCSGAGNAPAQYKIIPRGKISEFAVGRVGSANGPVLGICIKRKFLKTQEKDILNFVHAKIDDRLILKTNL